MTASRSAPIPASLPLIRFSTEDIPAADRFEQWREERGKQLFGVTIEVEPGRRADFRGLFSAFGIGSATVSELQASSYRVSRTAADIARMPGHSLLISWQVGGPGWVQTGHGARLQAVDEDDIVISHSDQVFAGTPRRTTGFLYRAVKIPLLGPSAPEVDGEGLSATVLDTHHAIRRPLKALLLAITRGEMALPDAEAQVSALARLAMIAVGRLPARTQEGRSAWRIGLLHLARQALQRNYRRADVTPPLIAARLGISVRQLHILFEPSGQTFARTLSALRVEAAIQFLKANPPLTMVEISEACGFDSVATFYRAFRHHAGMAPGDMRSLLRRGQPSENQVPLRSRMS